MTKRFLSSAAAIGFALASFATVLPAQAATFAPGDLIKGPTDAVYYYGQNNKRYVFPTLKTYYTWYWDFSSVKTVTLADLGAIPLGGNVTYRPGVKLVKITTDPKVYAVAANGTLRWVASEQVAVDLYGSNWNTKVDDIPDAFFINYKVGDPITSATQFSPSGEMARATSINTDKNLSVNGPPIVTISADKTVVTGGTTVNLTVNATFQGSGTLSSVVIKNNNSTTKNCSTLPCTVTSDALAAGSTNAFTAEVTDSNGLTGKSSPVTVTVQSAYYGGY